MNHCETILEEIHRRLSTTVRSRPHDTPTEEHAALLNLVEKGLQCEPPPDTARLLRSFRGRLETAVRSRAATVGPLVLAMTRELREFLSDRRVKPILPPLSQTTRYVKGVGERVAALLATMNVRTVEDLVLFFPYRYEDRRNLRPIAELQGEGPVTVQGIVRSVDLTTTPRKRFRILHVLIADASGTLVAKWFNQAYLKKVFQPGRSVMLSGRIKRDPYTRHLEMENPEYEMVLEDGEETIHTNRIVPIYHLTAGLTQRRLRTIIFHLLASHLQELQEILPADLLAKYHLPGRLESIRELHLPETAVSLEGLNAFRSRYHKRMIFEEFFLLETALALSRRGRAQAVRGISFQVNTQAEKALIRSLPFALTAAQDRVIREIKRDMGRPVQMSRLLQGDVGCGKTLVAAVAAGIALENGYQVAVMAPTEILAEQIYFHFRRFFDMLGRKTVLLTRLVKSRDRGALREQIGEGGIQVVVGTQALIQREVRFNKLGLVIIDEQHRFGVVQRAALMEKGGSPDVLVMTATPIPRSLSLTVYGDLDISVIDEMPPGRIPVCTEMVRGKNRHRVYRHIEEEVNHGRQAYVVCPLVEETEKTDLAAATEMSQRLSREIFPGRSVGLLHGRMHPEEKESIMESFRKGRIHILVATSVVEVGVDVANATIMVIEHAERFGLAQLHQLRGRVGRGQDRAYCYLMAAGRMTEEALRRLAVMTRTTDGFKIAEEDLAIRGPGEFLGKRQSGMPELGMGNILRDFKILEAARTEAFGRMERNPRLETAENRRLLVELKRRYAGKLAWLRVG